MEHIPNYDDWKMSAPEPKPVCRCNCCDAPMYEGDVLYTIDGGICEECLRDYRSVL